MTTQHPIRCPQCALDQLEPHFAGPLHSPAALTAFTCTRCGHRWQAFETPEFPAPDYHQAYGTAPDLAEEEIVLGLWAEGINTRAQAARANSGRAVDSGGYRLFYLRQAAYLDRAAREMELALYCRLVTPDETAAATSAAVESAALLLHLDLDLGQVHVEGPFGPYCAEWQAPGGSRAYVRQEYTAWQEWEVGARLRRA